MLALTFATCFLLVITQLPAMATMPYLTTGDMDGMKRVFTESLTKPNDIGAVYYGLAGLKLLNQKPPTQGLCDFVKSKTDASKVETLFYGLGASAAMGDCKIDIPRQVLSDAIGKEGVSTEDIYYAVSALSSLGGLDATLSAKVSTALSAATKKDDSALSLAYGFHTAAMMSGETAAPTGDKAAAAAKKFPLTDRIEDAVAQADEVDGRFLQYEGGLSATAIIVSGIFKLADKSSTSPMKAEQAVQFARFLLNRKGVTLVRPAYHVLSALRVLSANKFHLPVSIALHSSTPSAVQIHVSNVFGEPLPTGTTVVVDSATHLSTNGVVLNKKALSPAAGADKTLFEFNFVEQKRERGFYKLTIGVTNTGDKRLAGGVDDVTLKISTEISIDRVEISVSDREQAAAGGTAQKITYPSKLATIVDADTHQRITMTFVVVDKAAATAPIRVHQAFVVFAHIATHQEIVFVAEPDETTRVYKFDVDVQKSAKDFDFLSGKYAVKLIVGDAVVGNPIIWHLADVALGFPAQERAAAGADAISYAKKPEIAHMFREPDKRPPSVVSLTFTALVLAPLLLLLALWARIGVSFSGFSLQALGFHVGLGGVFALYAIFWLRLNMFVTLKYLTVILFFTYMCGMAMLRAMADKRRAKTD